LGQSARHPRAEDRALAQSGKWLALLINAFCLWLTFELVKGFEVHGFWPAVVGALCVSVVSFALNAFVSDRGRVVVITRRPPPREHRQLP
jgi:hypothetical protein